MTQKERLANLLDEFWLEHFDACNTDAMTEHLLSNGVIVPPCKVGDTIYVMWYRPISKEYFIIPTVVEDIVFTKIGWFVQTEDTCDLYDRLLNKDWFTDREEAEKALKERESGG